MSDDVLRALAANLLRHYVSPASPVAAAAESLVAAAPIDRGLDAGKPVITPEERALLNLLGEFDTQRGVAAYEGCGCGCGCGDGGDDGGEAGGEGEGEAAGEADAETLGEFAEQEMDPDRAAIQDAIDIDAERSNNMLGFTASAGAVSQDTGYATSPSDPAGMQAAYAAEYAANFFQGAQPPSVYRPYEELVTEEIIDQQPMVAPTPGVVAPTAFAPAPQEPAIAEPPEVVAPEAPSPYGGLYGEFASPYGGLYGEPQDPAYATTMGMYPQAPIGAQQDPTYTDPTALAEPPGITGVGPYGGLYGATPTQEAPPNWAGGLYERDAPNVTLDYVEPGRAYVYGQIDDQIFEPITAPTPATWPGALTWGGAQPNLTLGYTPPNQTYAYGPPQDAFREFNAPLIAEPPPPPPPQIQNINPYAYVNQTIDRVSPEDRLEIGPPPVAPPPPSPFGSPTGEMAAPIGGAGGAGQKRGGRIDDKIEAALRVARRHGGKVKKYPLRNHTDWEEAHDYEKAGGKLSYVPPEKYLSDVKPLKDTHHNKKVIHHFEKQMEKGEKLDPVAIYPDGEPNGRHRAKAAQKLGIDKIPVVTWPKTKKKGGSVVERALVVVSKKA